jgi:bifunctional DNA-binding transcriptional regulator/antitoxin component of YhaV-PrlF toxin-antitoxin module
MRQEQLRHLLYNRRIRNALDLAHPRLVPPAAIRDFCRRLGIRPGTVLEFTDEQGRLIAAKAEDRDSIDFIYGRFGHGRRTGEIMKDR